MQKPLKIEQDAINWATQFANQSLKTWEVFRDGRGAVDIGLSGTCNSNPKFRLIAEVKPQGVTHD